MFVQCEVLTGSGQIVHSEFLTDILGTVQREVLRDNGKSVQGGALTDN